MTLVLSQGRTVSSRAGTYGQLRETMSLVQRQVEDLRWDPLGAEHLSLDEPYGDRVEGIRAARKAAKRNPLAKVAINLLQHYTLGQGVSVKAANRQLVAKVVDEFMSSPTNKAVLTSHQAQKEFLEAIFTDGDYFLVLFPDKEEGTLELGYLDAALVEDTVPDAKNAKVTKWYKVKSDPTVYDFEQGRSEPKGSPDFIYYRHWQNTDEVPRGMGSRLKEGLVYQVSVDKRGKFGRSQLATAIDWLRAHREFMEDRATINKAAAAVAWKKKRKGPASDIAAEAERLRSALTKAPGRYDSNPPSASGSTIIENDGTNLEWVKTETGGTAADFDERKLRMMAGSGLGGIPNHYFGDEAQANLATATAMELPLLKAYEDWQQTIRATLLDLIEFLLQCAHEAGRIGEKDTESRYTDREMTQQAVIQQAPPVLGGPAQATTVTTKEAVALPYTPMPSGDKAQMVPRPDSFPTHPAREDDPSKPISWYVDIDFPPIVQKEIDKYMTALNTLSTLLPGETIESRKLVAELALSVFGVNDIDETMQRLFPPDMVAVLAPPAPEMVGQPGLPAPPPRPAPFPVKEDEPPDLPEPAILPVASLAAIRRRRLIRVAEEAAAAVAVVG